MNRKNAKEILHPTRAMTQEEEHEIIQKHILALREHFDGVVILTARTDRDGSSHNTSRIAGHALLVKGMLDQAAFEYDPNPPAEEHENDY